MSLNLRRLPFVGLFLLLVSNTSFAQDMALNGVLIDGEGWKLLGEGYKFTEGPAVDDAGNVYFVDVPEAKIYKIDQATDKITLFVENSGNASGLMFGPGGKLYACQNKARKIVTYDAAGKETVLAEDIGVNDLVVDKHGGVYVTDPANKQVWYITAKGEKKVVAKDITPNGIILWGDGGTLVVTEGTEAILWTYRVEKDGSLKFKERYYGPLQMPAGKDRPGSDGMTVDEKGRLYVATQAGLQMFDPTGRLGGAILKPQQKFLSNVCFGGANLDTLYVTCQDKVYKRKTQTKGVRYYKSEPVK